MKVFKIIRSAAFFIVQVSFFFRVKFLIFHRIEVRVQGGKIKELAKISVLIGILID